MKLSKVAHISDKVITDLPFRLRKFIFLSVLIFYILPLDSQVTGVKYQLKFNTDSCWYDTYLIIDGGDATSVEERTQSIARFSVLVPAGTYIDVIKTYMPLKNNETFSGTEPIEWWINSVIGTPTITPEFDYYRFSPSLDDPSHYNNLSAGDTIKLFSLVVDTVFNCGEGIRLFINGQDPASDAPGMGFINFSQRFILGTDTDVYTQNSLAVFPPLPDLSQGAITGCNSGLEIDVEATTSMCQYPLSYDWSGPNNFTSSQQDIQIIQANYNATGNYKLLVKDVYGCKDSLIIYAENKPYGGEDVLICPGTDITLQGFQPSSGNWSGMPDNPAGATIIPGINGASQISFSAQSIGNYQFIYSTGYCSDTVAVYVNSSPTVIFDGPDHICQGSTTKVLPDSDGFWVSNHPEIALVTNAGEIQAIAAGVATFTYTSYATGCSAITTPLTVNAIPLTTVTGTGGVCPGSTTTLSPDSGGVWWSENTAIADVNNFGIVTGIIPGSVSLTYTESGTGCTSAPLEIQVFELPTPVILGPHSICVDAMTQIAPTNGGVWESLQPAIAGISNDGTVLALSPGIAFFRWTQSETGCTIITTNPITVSSGPQLTMSTNEICSGSAMLVLPNSGGMWSSNNPSVATIGLNTGVVTTISAGTVTFTYLRQSDGCFATTPPLTVHPSPDVSVSSTNLCVGSTAALSPSSGGVWYSFDTEIVTVAGSTAIGTGNGLVSIQYTSSSTGCKNGILINVNSRPNANVTGNTSICKGFLSQLSPSSGGSWSSSNPAVATVDANGVVTGINQGFATFIFNESSTGCNSLPSIPIQVLPLPEITLVGMDSICIGGTTLMSAYSSGYWTSSNDNIAQIEGSSGIITGIAAGTVHFIYTSLVTGCTSAPGPNITIIPVPTAYFDGPQVICTGGSTQLLPSFGGIWTSSNNAIATVSNSGLVTTTGAGNVTFTFTETAYSCFYESKTDTLTITACFQPDINITRINVAVSGDVSTNDENASENFYSTSPFFVKGPDGGIPSISMNTDGTYVFQANIAGKYYYDLPVCTNQQNGNCPASSLVITVVDEFLTQKMLTANTDMATTFVNQPVTIQTLANDACITLGGCNIDPISVSIVTSPNNGYVSINTTNGHITYTPNNDFAGIDDLYYRVCTMDGVTICDTARQIITVQNVMAGNSLLANDDLLVTNKKTPIVRNILLNDQDPEYEGFYAVPQAGSGPSGDFSLSSNGTFTFTPAPNFTGPLNMEYEICDNHIPQLCRKATIYIMVLKELEINIRVYLEGALMNTNTTHNGRPLMRDNLRISPFDGTRNIPDQDPYKTPTTYINITNKYKHFGPGNLAEFHTISNPNEVFSISGPNAIVDWVFVELRSKTASNVVIATRSGLLQRDGDIVDIDGISSLRFPGVIADEYFVVIRHRNHLGVMSKFPKTMQQLADTLDFTLSTTEVFDFGTSKNNGMDYTGLAQNPMVKPGFCALWAGDFDANKKIKSGNPNDDINIVFFEIFMFPTNNSGSSNFDFAIGYFQGDFDMNSKAKFDNPNDDKNMVFGQLLFYPLNLAFLSNFDFFIEQVP